jgi:hypothetical protein
MVLMPWPLVLKVFFLRYSGTASWCLSMVVEPHLHGPGLDDLDRDLVDAPRPVLQVDRPRARLLALEQDRVRLRCRAHDGIGVDPDRPDVERRTRPAVPFEVGVDRPEAVGAQRLGFTDLEHEETLGEVEPVVVLGHRPRDGLRFAEQQVVRLADHKLVRHRATSGPDTRPAPLL